MTRVLLAAPLFALLLLACGAQEDPEVTADTPAVESAPGGAALAVKTCLDLVAAEAYADAVPACEGRAGRRAGEHRRAQRARARARRFGRLTDGGADPTPGPAPRLFASGRAGARRLT